MISLNEKPRAFISHESFVALELEINTKCLATHNHSEQEKN